MARWICTLLIIATPAAAKRARPNLTLQAGAGNLLETGAGSYTGPGGGGALELGWRLVNEDSAGIRVGALGMKLEGGEFGGKHTLLYTFIDLVYLYDPGDADGLLLQGAAGLSSLDGFLAATVVPGARWRFRGDPALAFDVGVELRGDLPLAKDRHRGLVPALWLAITL